MSPPPSVMHCCISAEIEYQQSLRFEPYSRNHVFDKFFHERYFVFLFCTFKYLRLFILCHTTSRMHGHAVDNNAAV